MERNNMANNRWTMKGEILSIETAEKLARLDKTLKYIDELLRKAYTTYNLTTETLMYLQEIETILKGR